MHSYTSITHTNNNFITLAVVVTAAPLCFLTNTKGPGKPPDELRWSVYHLPRCVSTSRLNKKKCKKKKQCGEGRKHSGYNRRAWLSTAVVWFTVCSLNTWVNPVATIGKTKQLRGTTACVNVKKRVSILRFLFSSRFQIRTDSDLDARLHREANTAVKTACWRYCVVWSVCDCALMDSWSSWLPNLCCVWEIQTQLGVRNKPKTLF